VFLFGRAEEPVHRFLGEFQWPNKIFPAVYHQDGDFHPRCKVGRFCCRWKFILIPESPVHKNTKLKAVFHNQRARSKGYANAPAAIR